MGKKKGGKKGGGKKGKGGGKKGGGSAGKTAAVGSILQPPSSFSSWKEGIPKPVVHRTAPSLMPHRQPPALQTKVPIDIVRAALVGNALAVSAWMTRGGSIDATWDKPDGSARGFTMLMLACMRGLVPMTEWLIKRGAGIDLRNSAGATALILSAHHQRRSVVNRLLRAGCQTDVRANPPTGIVHGPTALDIAERNGFVLIAELIRTHDAVTAGNPPTELPLVIKDAAVGGDVMVVTEWLDVGGPVEAPWKGGGEINDLSLLFIGSTHGHEPLVNALLKRQASVESSTPEGLSAMKIAAYAGHREVTRRLLLHQLKTGGQPAFYTPRAPPIKDTTPVSEWALEFRARIEKSHPWLARPA